MALLLSILTGCYDDQAENKHGLSSIPLSGFTYRGVVDRSIKLNFQVDKGEVTKITARIETQYDYDFPLNYDWKLGEGVSVINGDLKGQVAHMRKGAPIEIELAVTGFTKDVARFVRFEILGTNPQKRAFVDGVINSQEKSFEKIVQEIEEYKKSNQ
jgi:hypothetical protein